MKIGFIGLGRMGRPMAQNLLTAGFELTVYNRSRGVVEELAGVGARPAVAAAEVSALTDMVLTCLPDVATVEEVYLAAYGLIPTARPGQVLVDHSTVGPATSRAIAEAAQARGVTFLDAPISGGVERAADATLTIMVGGDPDAYASALPVLHAMGAHEPGILGDVTNADLTCVHEVGGPFQVDGAALKIVRHRCFLRCRLTVRKLAINFAVAIARDDQ